MVEVGFGVLILCVAAFFAYAHHRVRRESEARGRALAEAERARLDAERIVDTVNKPLAVLDASLRVRKANRAFHSSFGTSPGDVLGRRLPDLLQGQWNIPELLSQLGSVFSVRSEVERFEVVAEFPGSGRRTMVLNARRIESGPEDDPLAFLAILDITKQRSAEEERDRFFNMSLDMLCICGVDGRFRRINRAWKKTLGFELEELTTEPFISFVHPGDRDRTTAAFRNILEGSDLPDFENRYRCKDGSYRWLQWSATPVRDGELVYAVARDITERKAVEESLRQSRDAAEAANKELEAFSYSVSHDLRAPLRSIDGFSQALLDDCGAMLDDSGRDHLHRVRAAAGRMSQLIDDLLNLSRLNRVEMRLERVQLSDLVRKIAGEMAKAQPERQVDLTVHEDVVAEGDSRLLRVALENLLGNAWKYTRGRPVAHIEVGSRRSDRGRTIYYVRDDGAGFDMTYSGRLFGAFQRLHSPEDFEGTGIGLATVARIIHRHGGSVWAEGEVDKGATFYFTL